jgi:hypothetical protein
MTIALAWIRTVRDCEELIFASDSRLSGDGRTFDCCPKIFALPRTDCAVSFAGYTGDAFPLLLQLGLAIDSHAPARRGSLDITALKSHALKIFDEMAGQIDSPHTHLLNPSATLLFGGYSWIKKRFELWTIRYSNTAQLFTAEPAAWIVYSLAEQRIVIRRRPNRNKHISIGRIAIVGDQSDECLRVLSELLQGRRFPSSAVRTHRLDMEPFEALRNMLRDPGRASTIGGAPQILKVYQYMSTAPLGVYWPDKASGRIVLHGRATLGYERIDRFVLDPDTLRSERQLTSEPDAVSNIADAAV